MKTGICPVCNGSTRIDAGNYKYREVIASYRKEDNTLACRNCGGQTMYGTASGTVPLRSDGTPCKHEYVEYKKGNCYYVYICKHCGHSYDIDSGD